MHPKNMYFNFLNIHLMLPLDIYFTTSTEPDISFGIITKEILFLTGIVLLYKCPTTTCVRLNSFHGLNKTSLIIENTTCKLSVFFFVYLFLIKNVFPKQTKTYIGRTWIQNKNNLSWIKFILHQTIPLYPYFPHFALSQLS